MADRFLEHPQTVLVLTNLAYADAPWLAVKSLSAASSMVWHELPLSGSTAYPRASTVTNGARIEPRIREHFDRLVDRISAYEVKALAEGDGFTEKKYEAASIDQLLAETTTFGPPPAPPGLAETVQSDLETSAHDIPIPLNQRVLAYIQLFEGRLHDFIEEGLKRGGKYLPMIQNVFRAEGLPLDLAYVPKYPQRERAENQVTESDFENDRRAALAPACVREQSQRDDHHHHGNAVRCFELGPAGVGPQQHAGGDVTGDSPNRPQNGAKQRENTQP